MRRIVLIVVAALSVATTNAEPATLITPDTVRQGNTQFARTCAQCHGRNLVSSGTSAPDLRRFPADQEARFIESVTNGKGNMPAFREAIAPEQIALLWAYVSTRGGKEMPEPANAALPEKKAEAPMVRSTLPLKVCMAEDNAPLSHLDKGNKAPQGFDVRIAEAIATALARPLAVVMFESKYEQESTLSQEVNALLASGVCDLASGFPLIASDLGAPGRATARVPDYPGAPRRPNRAWIPLVPLAATQAYHAAALGVVARDPALTVARLDDLRSSRIGATAGSMAGAMLMMYKSGLLRSQVVSLSKQDSIFAKLEAGEIDAILAPSDQLDAWKISHPGTPLRRTAYLHPMRINLGFVARADAAELIATVNAVVAKATADGSLQRWAHESGSTWVAPVAPNVRNAPTMAELATQ